ncbi:MAG: outer membrane beta-barrel protein [Pedobacter sp.]|nr:outer membrane beta-barrel protein [Chitinophagaceae bacterium]
MKQFAFLLFTFFIGSFTMAQTTGSVKGTLLDSSAKQSLKDASISILEAGDSTVEVSSLAKGDGSFEIKDIPYGNFLIRFSFQGYSTVMKKLSITKEKADINLGNIYLQTAAANLSEVIVVSTPPITVKKDTLEFNAGSFKTKPNAVVEDLLKKLPGVLVDKDGNVNAQGENVARILVDGKRFFGNDPKMATKNLPPDIVDKIQVYDAQSDQSAFSGFDDGTRTKTINIITKKDRRKGLFGRFIAGAGDQGRYDASVNLNLFNGNQKITLLSSANNINKQSFTAMDGGGSGRSRGGITDTKSVGLNYSDLLGKTDVAGSYFYNNLNTNRDAKSFTERFDSKSDTSIFVNQKTNSNRLSENHRFNFNFESKIDSMNSLIIRPDISFQNGSNVNQVISQTTRGLLFGNGDVKQNDNNQTTTSKSDGYNGDMNATFRHRFKTRGHTFSISLTGSGSNNNSTGTNYGNRHLYTPKDSIILIDQVSNTVSKSNGIISNFSYTFPIVKNHIVELSYGYNKNNSNSDKETYSYDNTSKDYTHRVDSLSNYFQNENSSNRVTIGYRVQTEKINFGIANGIQYTNLKSDNTSKGTHFDRNFTNIYPTANFIYNFTKKKNLRINYNGRSNQPSVAQLQPVPDNSNSNNIILGNPQLGQEFSHSIRLLFTSVNPLTFRNISALISGSTTSNKVVSSITDLGGGTQSTTYENMNGSFNLYGNINYGFQLKNPKSNLNFISNISYSRDVSLINAIVNYTTNTRFGEAINWTMNLNEKLDLNFNTTYNYNIAKYSIKTDQNRDYYTQSFSVEPTYTFNGGWVLGSDFDYTYNSGLTAGYNASLPLWNASLAKQLFKKKEGEIKFSVTDILKQNVSVSRNVTNNYVQDVQNNVLQRYFLITFTYNLRKFPGGPQQKRGEGFRNGQFPGGNRGEGGGNRGGGFGGSGNGGGGRRNGN